MKKLLLLSTALTLFITPANAQFNPGGGFGGGGGVGSGGVTSFSSTCPATGPNTGAITLSNGVGVVAKSTNYAVVAADCGTLFETTGTTTLTLPALAGLPSGFAIAVFNAGSNTVTVASNGALSNINMNGTTSSSVTQATGQPIMTVAVNSAGNGWDASIATASGSGAKVINRITCTPSSCTQTAGTPRRSQKPK